MDKKKRVPLGIFIFIHVNKVLWPFAIITLKVFIFQLKGNFQESFGARAKENNYFIVLVIVPLRPGQAPLSRSVCLNK